MPIFGRVRVSLIELGIDLRPSAIGRAGLVAGRALTSSAMTEAIGILPFISTPRHPGSVATKMRIVVTVGCASFGPPASSRERPLERRRTSCASPRARSTALGLVWLEGEVTQVTKPASGHLLFLAARSRRRAAGGDVGARQRSGSSFGSSPASGCACAAGSASTTATARCSSTPISPSRPGSAPRRSRSSSSSRSSPPRGCSRRTRSGRCRGSRAGSAS